MASYRKVGKKWRAEVRIKGRSARKTLPTKIEAQSWAVDKEKEFGRRDDSHKGHHRHLQMF